jgi:hypothetical protein
VRGKAEGVGGREQRPDVLAIAQELDVLLQALVGDELAHAPLEGSRARR